MAKEKKSSHEKRKDVTTCKNVREMNRNFPLLTPAKGKAASIDSSSSSLTFRKHPSLEERREETKEKERRKKNKETQKESFSMK